MVAGTNFKKLREGLTGLVQDGKHALYTAAAKVEQNAPTLIAQANQAGQYLQQKVQRAQEIGRAVVDRVQGKYDQFEDEFFTNGEFNRERAAKALENMVDATERFGTKAVEQLREMAISGAEAVKQDYRNVIPTAEERSGKYAAIGSEYKGILFRQDYDNCLEFYQRIGPKLQVEDCSRILGDVRAYAIGSKAELMDFYRKSGETELVRKVRLAK